MPNVKRKNRVLIAKPGLDGHDRGVKIIARALRDNNFEVIYTGIRQTPDEIASTALQEDVAAVGLSSLSGAHLRLFPAVIEALKKINAGEIPVLGGGIIPDDDLAILMDAGIKEIFTPGTSIEDIVEAFRKACEEYHRDQSSR
jgi:methylmalonyl-CoA mutase C-terminal domain/subunit